MGRRKQAHPQPLLGPPESRQDRTEADVNSSLTPSAAPQNRLPGHGRLTTSLKALPFTISTSKPDVEVLPLRHIQIDNTDSTNLREHDSGCQIWVTADADSNRAETHLTLSLNHDDGCHPMVSCAYALNSTSCMYCLVQEMNYHQILQGAIQMSSSLVAESLLSLLQQGVLAVWLSPQQDQSTQSSVCIGLHQSSFELDAPSGKLCAPILYHAFYRHQLQSCRSAKIDHDRCRC